MSDEKLLVSRDLLVRLQEALSTSYCPEKSLCTELWRALLAQPSDGALTNEPVAVVDESDDGLFVELIYGEDGNPLRRGDKLYLSPPAPASVVLPDRLNWEAWFCGIESVNHARGWNACLDRVKELNS